MGALKIFDDIGKIFRSYRKYLSIVSVIPKLSHSASDCVPSSAHRSAEWLFRLVISELKNI